MHRINCVDCFLVFFNLRSVKTPSGQVVQKKPKVKFIAVMTLNAQGVDVKIGLLRKALSGTHLSEHR